MTTEQAKAQLLGQLQDHRVLTEHELSNGLAARFRLKTVDVQPQVAKLLIALRDEGLIWAGQLFNKGRQHMWCAALTQAGKDKAKHEPQHPGSRGG